MGIIEQIVTAAKTLSHKGNLGLCTELVSAMACLRCYVAVASVRAGKVRLPMDSVLSNFACL
jgi:hypothetical protein